MKVMNQSAIRSKLTYFIWILLFTSVALSTGLWMYEQTSQISLTEGVVLKMEGMNGNAVITGISNESASRNSSKAGFFDQVSYRIEPHENLYNGQLVTISAHADQELLRRYQVNPVQSEMTVMISGLPETPGTSTLKASEHQVFYGSGESS